MCNNFIPASVSKKGNQNLTISRQPRAPSPGGRTPEGRPGARKGAPPVAESSDRSGWAGTCLCTNEVQGKGLVPTRVLQICNCSV